MKSLSTGFGGRQVAIEVWRGQVLPAPVLAFDTETTCLTEPRVIPDFVLASVYDGGDTVYLVPPQGLAQFLDLHRERRYVMHNCAFDFWVVHKHLVRGGEEGRNGVLWQAVEDNRVVDTMILDMLTRLGSQGGGGDDTPCIPRTLGAVAHGYLGAEVDKQDPYRKRFAELLTRTWEDAAETDPGFFTYAARDAVATFQVWEALMPLARQLHERHRRASLPGSESLFGPLSLGIQVKGAIAIAQMERQGIAIDRQKVDECEKRLEEQYWGAAKELSALAGDRQVFYVKDGKPVLNTGGGLSVRNKVLQELLLQEWQECRAASPTLPDLLTTPSGEVSLAEGFWDGFTKTSSLASTYVDFKKAQKALQYPRMLVGDRAYSRYGLMSRTGRTTCSDINLQQIPRGDDFRECFVADKGKMFVAEDYSFAELVTLAATCRHRFGYSKLGDVINAGRDPHIHVAAIFSGMAYEEFEALKATDETKYKDLRQKAKAINFGIPGGMAAWTLQEYALDNYKTHLTLEEASRMRQAVLAIYTEVEKYLAHDSMACLAYNLGCSLDWAWTTLSGGVDRPEWLPRYVEKVVQGFRNNYTGKAYSQERLDSMWKALARCCPPESPLLKPILARQAGPVLHRRLFGKIATTLTGRVRAGTKYTESRNTPFQGLAADAGKLALWHLTREGFSVLGFVHDEIIVEVPDDEHAMKSAIRVRDIMIDAMVFVTGGCVKPRAEGGLTRAWTKKESKWLAKVPAHD